MGMGEDSGKPRFIRDFLQRIKPGDGFYDDMRIERAIRLPGSDGEGSTARSLSGSLVDNVTKLLEDDLRHTFDNGFFTFRLVNAHFGGGKTSLLHYLQELAKTKPTYKEFSAVSFFRLSDIQSIGGNQSFTIKFYSHILGHTFWELLNNENVLVKKTAKNILNDYLEPSEVSQLLAITSRSPFCSRFRKYFSDSGVVFEELFFESINRISYIESRFTFAYLIDELDHLGKSFPNEFQEARSLIKSLVRGVYQKFSSKMRLLIYLAGTSENVKQFINDDPVIESLVGHQVIVLSKGYENEFELVKAKIDERIKGAFKGYQDFNEAWSEIQTISIDPAQNLRSFYRNYVTAVLEIYEKYFKERPENEFEGNARELMEVECRQKWQSYLNQKAYLLSSAPSTTKIANHNFDCCVELLHNGVSVARAYGEAKNYELLTSHLETFNKWLEDASFNPHKADGNPPDLAFMIAPSCPSLLKRKLELKNIHFIQSNKVVGENNGNKSEKKSSAVNINTATKDLIVAALKGTGMRGTTVDKLINLRSNKSYKNIDDLASDLKLTSKVKEGLQKKLNSGKIYFF
ncbi:hypothetical protein K9N68_18100 [Kovacikia minuta CCNUW1]|uniref:hypothetical protein n=1 Tax=Kovacikia minuta TaxID=2931930 RepID=UPI001CCDD771|nr:hypothetical protein [Kovacikia minuta]UBF23685.1 hypothetical protein K9N68_18100 [Kovacikia minuta CCNUW1]